MVFTVTMPYVPAPDRYQTIPYRRSGKSGLHLPPISLGLWHNFGGVDVYENSRAMVLRSFDLGITHFDLANNYGPPPGSAEENFGQMLKHDLGAYRDELIISTKAGYRMWDGPYGEWGSRKNLLASLDQSLKRMGLEYVDIFYSHRFDPNTPLEETMGAVAHAVKSGKALYAAVSSYSAEATREAHRLLKEMGVPLLIHQPNYNMFNRWIETEHLVTALEETGTGCIAFCPLAQGLLTNRYLAGIPEDSRAAKSHGFLKKDAITEARVKQIQGLNAIALARGQSLAQMAIAWVLRLPVMTSALIGASKVSQIEENMKALDNLAFSKEESDNIEALLAG